MKRLSYFVLSFALFLTVNLVAQNAATAPPDWENPHVFGINKEPGRATFTPFPDESSATGKDQPSKFVESLNGKWKFNWVKSPDLRPVDFYKPDFDVNSWKEIPCSVELGNARVWHADLHQHNVSHLSATPRA